jgi:hypothetical protein
MCAFLVLQATLCLNHNWFCKKLIVTFTGVSRTLAYSRPVSLACEAENFGKIWSEIGQHEIQHTHNKKSIRTNIIILQ